MVWQPAATTQCLVPTVVFLLRVGFGGMGAPCFEGAGILGAWAQQSRPWDAGGHGAVVVPGMLTVSSGRLAVVWHSRSRPFRGGGS